MSLMEMDSKYRAPDQGKLRDSNNGTGVEKKEDPNTHTLTRISAKIGNGASTVPTFADTEPRLTVINTAKPSAVIGDDITIGN